MGLDEGSWEEGMVLEMGNTTRWQQRTRSKFTQASGSSGSSGSPSEALALGIAFTALSRCLNLCSLNFWIENYASAAVEMQMCGDKIPGLKQTVDSMLISTSQSSPGLEAGVAGAGGRPRAHLNSSPRLLLTSHYSRERGFQTTTCTALCSCDFLSL